MKSTTSTANRLAQAAVACLGLTLCLQATANTPAAEGSPAAPGSTAPAVAAPAGALAADLYTLLGKAALSHPSVVEKRNSLAAAQSALESARWQRYPSLTGESSANPTSGSVVNLRVDQPLWTGGRINAAIDAGQAKLAAAESGLAEAQQQILQRTASLFAELVRLGLRLDAAKDNIAEHQRLLDLIQRRSDSGIASPSEVISAKARLQQARTELVQLQTASFNARADLEQVTGMTIAEVRMPKPELEMKDDLSTQLEKCLAFSPGLRRLAAETQAAEAEIQTRKSVLYPKVSLRHERLWGRNYPSSVTYVALTVQTGNGLSAGSAISEAQAQRSAAIERELNLRRDVADSARADWNKVRSAKAETAILRELVEATRDMYESFVRQYAAGRKSWLDVLNARSESIKARNSLVDTEWNGMLALWRLRIVSGELTAESLAAMPATSGLAPQPGQILQVSQVLP